MATLKVDAPLVRPLGTTLSYVDTAGVLRIISFDATLQDTHQGAAEASMYALDTNASITDHVRSSPRGLSIQAEVTNTPLIPVSGGVEISISAEAVFQDFRFARAGGGNRQFIPILGSIETSPVIVEPASQRLVSSGANARTIQYQTVFDRVRDTWTALDQLRDTGTPLQVVTRLRTYDEMVIVNLVAPHEIADAIVFSIDLVEIRRADSLTIQVDPPVLKTEKRAQKEQPAANKAGYKPAPAQSESLESLILDYLAKRKGGSK